MRIKNSLLAFALLALLSLGLTYAVFAAGQVPQPPVQTQVAGAGGSSAPTPQQVQNASQAAQGAPPPAQGVGAGAAPGQPPAQVQDVYVRALGGANFGTYDKSELVVKKGVPVRLHFSADADAGCGKTLVVSGLNVRLSSPSGSEVVAEFTPQEAGTYEYSCSMHMFGPGRLVVQ
ncbi:Cupredoxin-like domain protein [Candidatus Burarchaeum australiense]|nr:Cupredoxin-like domain protein [Candidatus Burarchaeum australiense]